MKAWKIYKITMEDRDSVFNLVIPAPSKQAAIDYVSGNGEIILIREDDYPISKEKVANALLSYGFGKAETDIVTRALNQIGLAD